MITARDVIQKTRDRQKLTSSEISSFLRGYMSSQITDYHVAAWLMAVYLNGMSTDETLALTREMRDSGKVLDLSAIPGKKIDKHSTGGVRQDLHDARTHCGRLRCYRADDHGPRAW